jgi:hypothetical protein
MRRGHSSFVEFLGIICSMEEAKSAYRSRYHNRSRKWRIRSPLVSGRTIDYYRFGETDMKGGIGIRIWRWSAKGFILLAALLLMFPASASVVCIAPGDHVAIENLDALCCKSSAITAQDYHSPGNEPGMASDCRSCTDLLISLNERGAIPKSYGHVAGASSTDECDGACPSIIASPLFIQNALNDSDAGTSAFSSIPLRC